MSRGIKLLIALVTLYHVCLVGRGALAWPDEHLYRDALSAVDALATHDIAGFGRSLTGFGARPAEATLRLVPATVQKMIARAGGLEVFSPASLRIAVLPNILSSLLLVIVFYRLSRSFFRDRPGTAELATAVYALLGGNHVWLRHVVPYDTALMLDLTALLLCLRLQSDARRPSRFGPMVLGGALVAAALLAYSVGFYRHRSAGLLLALAVLCAVFLALALAARGVDRRHVRDCVLAGLCAGFGLATYPAYYSFVVGLTAFVAAGGVADRPFRVTSERLRTTYLFVLAVMVVLFSYETLGRLGEVSYLGCAARLSRTITQGSFEEGFIFLPKYLLAVEGPIGGVLIVLAALGMLGMIACALRRSALSPGEAALARCVFVMAVLYLVYGAQSALLHRMTFTGRYIRMYVPFIVWSAVFVVGRIPALRIRRSVAGLALAASALSFASFAREYAAVDYPADVLYRLGIGFEDLRPENVVYETEIRPAYDLPVKEMTAGATYVTHPDDDRFAIVNFGFLWLDGAFLGDYVPPPGARLLYEAPHFLTFRTSVFEAYPIWKRQEMRSKRYRLKVYELRRPNVTRSEMAPAPSETP
jgi:hypothetical protein